MSDINFSVKNLNLIGSDGYATIDSDNTIEINSNNYLNLNADTVGISTDITIGGQVSSDLIVGEGFYVGIGTDNPTSALDVAGTIKATALNLDQFNVVSEPFEFGLVGITEEFSPFGTDLGVFFISNIDDFSDTSALVHLGDNGGVLLTNYRADFVSDNGLYRFGPVENLVWDIYPSYLNQTFDAFYIGDDVFLASVDNKAYISAPDGIIFGGYGNVGIGTTNPESKLTVVDGDISVGINTNHGLILTSPNGTQYRLIVADDGTLDTVSV
jgi:hypothetical protein